MNNKTDFKVWSENMGVYECDSCSYTYDVNEPIKNLYEHGCDDCILHITGNKL